MKPSFKIYIIPIVLLVGLSGCKLGQKFQQPDLNMPEAYIHAAADSMRLAEKKWWDVYADTTLQRLISKAIDYNKDILASEARISEMSSRKQISFAQFFPNINGQAYAQRQGLNYGGDDYTENFEHGMKLSVLWELDLWGGKRWRHDRSKAQWREAIETNRNLIISIMADVAIAYYDLMSMDMELQAVHATIDSRQEFMDQAMRSDSLCTDLAYQQAQVESARLAARIPELEKNIRLKENELSFLCGQYPGHVERARSFKCDLIIDTIPELLSSDLLLRRPDIRAAEQQLIAANAEVGIAYTNRFPSFSLSAIGGLESDELKTLLKSPMHFLSPSLRIPVFDLGQLNAEYHASKHAYQAQCEDYENVVLAAFREVSDALVTFNKSKDIYAAMKKLRDVSGSALDLAYRRYLSGDIGYMDLLEAQRGDYDARISLIEAERDRHIALVVLYKSLGGGWNNG